jgi:cytoskeleton protein RodZ
MRIGPELKAGRKRAGISVQVISERTKIAASKLVALEKGDFKNLPTGVYLFAIVRAYAREVHIDPEPLVERLREDFKESDALQALSALDAKGALKATRLAGTKGERARRPTLFRNAAIAAGVVLVVAAASAYRYSHEMTLPVLPPSVRSLNRTSSAGAVPIAAPDPVTTMAMEVTPRQRAARQVLTPAAAGAAARESSEVTSQTEAVDFTRVQESEPTDRAENSEEVRPEPAPTVP